MSRRVLSVLALPVGVSVAAVAARFQGDEPPREKKASEKEEKTTSYRWWQSHQQKGTRNVKQCDLTGWWKNDLGSKMHVFEVENDGTFSGEYHTAVSSAKNPPSHPHWLDPSTWMRMDSAPFGFTVNWKKFSDSTAVFVGQCFNGDDDKEVLHTSWLLREKVDSQANDWKATRTGRNTFTRID